MVEIIKVSFILAAVFLLLVVGFGFYLKALPAYFSYLKDIKSGARENWTREKNAKYLKAKKYVKGFWVCFAVSVVGVLAAVSFDHYSTKFVPSKTAKASLEQLKTAKPGDSVLLGTCEQDKYSYANEPISWTVIDVQQGKVLLLADHVIAASAYFVGSARGSYKDSLLCQNIARLKEEWFIPLEKAAVSELFILSASDVEKYFPEPADRVTDCPEIGYEIGININPANWKSWWWLSDDIEDPDKKPFVGTYGTIDMNGIDVNVSNGGIRPAAWITVGN